MDNRGNTSTIIDHARAALAQEGEAENCPCFACTYGTKLIDVAEAAQGVIHDASLSDNYVSHVSVRRVSEALKKLPQVCAEDEL